MTAVAALLDVAAGQRDAMRRSSVTGLGIPGILRAEYDEAHDGAVGLEDLAEHLSGGGSIRLPRSGLVQYGLP